MKKILLAFLVLLPLAVSSQTDTTVTTGGFDIVEYLEDDDDEDATGARDTLVVEARSFDRDVLEDLKDDPDLDYKTPPTIAESLWQRFLIWLSQMLNDVVDAAVTTSWGRFFAYVAGLAALIVVIMLILKVDAFKVFYSGQGASTMKYEVLDENIHEIDFDKEIQLALQQGDYRRGVRLLFLYALKILSDRQQILWEQGKTNHEYVKEVKAPDLRDWLGQLSYYFDYAWYGNFTINRALFEKVNVIFSNWKSKVK